MVVNGEPHAEESRHARFERIYEENSHLILAYALRRTFTPADAADVVSETFLVAWRRLQDVPVGEEARLWLYGTARRVLANHHLSRRRARRLSQRVRGEVLATVARIDSSMVTGPDGDAIAEAFGRLRGDDREVLTLVGVEGLDRAEVAQVLGCTRANVRVRLHRARRRFAEELERVGIDLQRSTTAGHEGGRRASARLDQEEAL